MVLTSGGKLGLNTGAPASLLHIRQGGNGGTAITLENGEGIVQVVGDAGNIKLKAGGVTVMTVRADGNVHMSNEASASVIEIRGSGNDVAEAFKITSTDTEIRPGMVVSISAENAGELVLSSKSYERTVAGIISGAGDKHVGLQLGYAEEVKRGELTPVALTGQVWCYVDASYGAVVPGDLLTTSDTVGHAMKVTDYMQAQGAVIGKAMTPLKSGGKGLVLVLVSLQ